MDIFTAFIAVMDRLIQLVSARARSRREIFKEIVDPIYVELTPVVEAYFVILSRTRDELSKSTSADLQAITSELRGRRQQIFAARQSVTALVHELQAASHDHQLLSFCSKVQGLFYSSYHSEDQQRMSPTRWGVELLELLEVGGATRGQVITHLTETIRKLETAWVAVAQSHAAFQIRSLSKGVL